MSRTAWIGAAGGAALLLGAYFLGCAGCAAESGPAASSGGGGGSSAGGAVAAGGSGGPAGLGGGGAAGAASGGAAGATAGTSGTSGGLGGEGQGISNTGAGGYATVPVGTFPFQCGPGCRPLMAVAHTAGGTDQYDYHGGEWFSAASPGRKSLLLTDRLGKETLVYGNYPGSPAGKLGISHVAAHKDKLVALLYHLDTNEYDCVRVDRATGTLEMVPTSAAWKKADWAGVALLNDGRALMTTSAGIWSLDLSTGDSTQLAAASSCAMATVFGSRYVCLDPGGGRMWGFDTDTSKLLELGPSPKQTLQAHGGCALDGSHCAWVDYRDPPGDLATQGSYIGGDIYVRDMMSGQVERASFDAPTTSLTKVGATANQDLVVWMQYRDPTPTPHFELNVRDLVRLERSSGKKCIYENFVSTQNTLDGHKLIGSVALPSGWSWLVELDLDDPGIPWKCK